MLMTIEQKFYDTFGIEMCANCHRLYHNNDEEVVKKYNEVVNAKKL